MNGPRRGFLAFVGGAFVSGAVARVASATPTLILPPAVEVVPSWPLLEAQESMMHGVLDVMSRLPPPLFCDWLEGGLRQASKYAPQDIAATNRRRKAVESHGSLVNAIRAGAA